MSHFHAYSGSNKRVDKLLKTVQFIAGNKVTTGELFSLLTSLALTGIKTLLIIFGEMQTICDVGLQYFTVLTLTVENMTNCLFPSHSEYASIEYEIDVVSIHCIHSQGKSAFDQSAAMRNGFAII